MTSYEVVVDVSKVVHLARRHGIPCKKSRFRSFEVQANDPDEVCYLVITKLWFELTKEAFELIIFINFLLEASFFQGVRTLLNLTLKYGTTFNMSACS